ncbi:hypothetical protein I302_108539 [Kwoniella bestiolae CBS 10118]|uniref:D-3-phosphoglycerate dehydrogenase n=1 Tax=Kwoniella bestiolae CBS 10118 TaxID=1296100 RepID=A0A1B9FVE2_9TREE|nr:hypothetical protein I302_07088 [Kwoniella bestiolae CBS 10118]OCF22747.1 hypothetical protein I302_07088 [Kwoniella bestiolae CBS 10118]
MSPSAVPHKPRVFCLYPIDDSVREYAEQHFDFTCEPDPKVKSWREEAEAVMVRSNTITPSDVKVLGPAFKFVGKHGVGVDAIAVKELKERGITVMNTPGVNASAVAELALTMSLCLARDVAQIDRRIRSGETVTKAEGGLTGFQLTGKTLGLVGGGNIGYQLGKMFHGAFGAKVVVYDPHLHPSMVQKWSDLLSSSHFTRVGTLGKMLEVSDVVSIHVPLLESTRNLIGEDELRKMKKSALLINTARGGIVNEEALLRALEEGWITGAGIDAFSIEPPTSKDFGRLISHPRVLSTPHIGAASLDVIRITALAVIDHLVEAFRGEQLRDVVSV